MFKKSAQTQRRNTRFPRNHKNKINKKTPIIVHQSLSCFHNAPSVSSNSTTVGGICASRPF